MQASHVIMTVFALRMVKGSPANVLQVLMAHVVKSKVYLFIYSFIYCRLGNMFRAAGATGQLPALPKLCGGSTGIRGCPFYKNCSLKHAVLLT